MQSKRITGFVRGFVRGIVCTARAMGLVLSVGAVGLLTSCGGGVNQDPLASQPDQIRNGIPPQLDKKPAPPTPIQQEALRIDAPAYHDFYEAKEGSVIIKGRVLMPGAEFEILIANIDDFPGAVVSMVDPQNPMAGVKFTWTPPVDFSSGDYTRKRYLEVVLATTNTPVKLSTSESILLLVTRAADVPEVISVEDLEKDPVREGEERRFQFVVRDIDGFDGPAGRPNVLFIASEIGKGDIANVVELDSKAPVVQDPADPQRWIYTAWINLRDREITAGEEKFTFAILTTSRFGAQSAHKVTVTIRTSVREPVTSWKSPVTVNAGEEVVFNFQVYDPRFEGRVSVNFLERPEQVLGQATWDCPPVASLSEPLMCTIRWRVPLNPVRTTFEVPMELRNRSQVPGDRADATARVSGRFRVRQPPVPEPTPEPVPEPTPEPTPTLAPNGGAR